MVTVVNRGRYVADSLFLPNLFDTVWTFGQMIHVAGTEAGFED